MDMNQPGIARQFDMLAQSQQQQQQPGVSFALRQYQQQQHYTQPGEDAYYGEAR